MQYVENAFSGCFLLKTEAKNDKIITVIGVSIGVFCPFFTDTIVKIHKTYQAKKRPIYNSIGIGR